MTMIKTAFIKQRNKDHKAVYSNTSITFETDGNTSYKENNNTFKENKDLYQNSPRMLTNLKITQFDTRFYHRKNVFRKADIHGLSIEYAFKILLSEGLKILVDTGQFS